MRNFLSGRSRFDISAPAQGAKWSFGAGRSFEASEVALIESIITASGRNWSEKLAAALFGCCGLLTAALFPCQLKKTRLRSAGDTQPLDISFSLFHPL